MPQPSGLSAPERRKLKTGPLSKGDKWFFRTTTIASNFAFLLVALILIFLLAKSFPALQQQGPAFLFGSKWDPEAEKPVMQLGPMLWGSIQVAFLGILIATPMAISAAYVIVFMLHDRLAKIATTLIDLLAALPSVVIGLWGLLSLAPVAANWAKLLHETLGWLPFFTIKNDSGTFTDSPFIAGWIVAVMIVPIITSVTREIFSQMDAGLINGALALGGGRYTVFRQVILPTSATGILGGILLGLGRAIGETVAILYVLQLSMEINWFEILEPRGGAVASWILARFGEATPAEYEGLMAAGLVIFVVTLLVNVIANLIVSRSAGRRK